MRRSLLFLLTLLSSSIVAESQTDKTPNDSKVHSASDQSPINPGATLYVAKRFSVTLPNGLHGFSVGKKVTLVREDGSDYIVTDGPVQGRAPRTSFTQDISKIQATESKPTNTNSNSQDTIKRGVKPTPPAVELLPEPTPQTPTTAGELQAQKPIPQQSIGDTIRQLFKGDFDDVFMASYFPDTTLKAIGVSIMLLFALMLYLIISHRIRCSKETSEQRELNKIASQVKSSQIGIGISICGAMFFLMFYDTTVQTERHSAKYYNGIQVMPAIPSMRVHNLERANYQRNMIMVFFGLAIVNAIRLVSISRK